MEVGESGMPRPRDTPKAVKGENAHTSAVNTRPSKLEEVTPTQAVLGVVPREGGGAATPPATWGDRDPVSVKKATSPCVQACPVSA